MGVPNIWAPVTVASMGDVEIFVMCHASYSMNAIIALPNVSIFDIV